MSVEEKIVELLSTHPEGLTIARISKELNIHRNTASKYVFALVRSGILEQRRVGVASLCYLKKKKGFTIGRKSIAKLSLVFLALIIILIFLFHYTIPITGSASRVFNFTELNGYRLEIETEKQKFFSNELVKISGLLTFSNNPVENQSLFLTLISSDRIENQTVLTNSEGSFSSLLKLKEGNYTLIASSGELETSLNFEVIEAPFNLSLEKNCFKTNETVRIFVQGEAEKEFVLEIFGPIIENFTLKTNEEGSYTFERSFSIPGNYTARVLGSEVSFEVFEEKPEVNLKIKANETYWLEENISLEIEGSAETEFSLDIEKDEAKILSFFGKTNSSGLSEISFQVFEEGNYTARLNYEEKEDVAFFEVLKKNLTEAFEENVSVENVTENVSFLVVSVEQGKAEINKPVQWRKTIRVINPSDKDAEIGLPLELPENSFNLSLEEKETKRIFNLEEKRLKDKLKGKESKDYVLTYYTEAPVAKETVVNKYKKIVTISSSLHYENVLAYTEIEKAAKDAIKIYWLVNNEKIDITNNESFRVNLLDLDDDNLIERVEWLVPYLSEQTFEISIVILNPYTYLRDNEVWVVAFNTTGTADLKISSPNANWAEMLKDNKETFDEMEFLDIKCGNNSLKDKLLLVDEFNNTYNYSQLTEEDSLKVKQLLIEKYSCEETGYISNRMAKAGYAILKFDFGGIIAYAYDQSPCQVYINSLPYNITQNNTYYCLNTSSTNLAKTAIQFGNSSSWVIQNSTLDCQGFNIDGNDAYNTYGIYLTGSNTKNNTIKNCKITDFYYGIYLNNGPNNNSIINSIANFNSYGISLDSSSNNQIINSTSNSNSYYGIYLYYSSNNQIINSTSNYNSDTGIYLDSSSSNSIINSISNSNFYYGIYLYYSSNNSIINSTSNYNSDTGISLDSSSNNTIINSTLQENSYFDFYIYAFSDTECNNYLENIIGSGNRPIKYYNYSINLANEILSELILCNADNSNITNITIDASSSKNNNMLYVILTDNSNFTLINSSYNYYGIYLKSSSNNQIINSTSNSNSYGISLDSSSYNSIINSTANSNFIGIHLYSSSSNSIINSITNSNSIGIYLLFSSNNNQIINSTSNNNSYGIYLIFSSNNQIINSTLQENSNFDFYIYAFSDSECNNYLENIIGSGNRPIKYYNYSINLANEILSELILCNADNSNITNITIDASPSKKNNLLYVILTDNSNFTLINSSYNYYGIYLKSSSNNQIINSTANSNSYTGIYLYSSSSNSIINSTFNYNSWYGIYLESSSNNTIINSTLQENSYFDFYIYAFSNSHCNNYLENIIGSNNLPIKYYNYSVNLANEILSELILCNADNSNITNITIDASPSKKNNLLYVILTDNSNFTQINSSYNYYGIYLKSSSNNQIINSTSNSNSYGISLDSSSSNSIINSITNSNFIGIRLSSSSYNQIINSTLQENSYFDFYIYAFSNSHCNNYLENIIGSGNRPIKYYNYSVNLANEVLSELILCNADYSNITNITIDASPSLNNNMLYVILTDNSNFTLINSSYNYYGIYLISSSYNSIINSTFLNNDDDGVTLISSDYNKLENIYLSGFQDSSEDGIFYISSSNYNNITNITIANASASGFYLDSSNNNTISYSEIMNCGSYGIYLYSSQNNLIYNNLFNNTNNFYFEGDIYSNYWNTTKQLGQRIYSSGNYIGGNYWTNSTGNGFSDTCTDSNKDGFCDSPYTLSSTGSNIDYLPLSNKADVIPPQYSLNSTNSTLAGSAVSHNLFWQDNGGLSYAIFSFDNCTGSFQNITGMSLSGTSAWSNFTVVINSTVGCTIRWKVYANDTSNNWNASEIFSYTTTSATPCQVYINASSQLPYTITLNNTYYCLNSSSVNTTTNGILFASGVQNSTLDCLGFNIDGNKTSNTYGIYLTGSNTKNNTIKNCNITDFYYGIYLNNGPNNNSIINSTSYNNNYGILLYYSSNNNQIINSTANSNFIGIYLYSSSNNNTIINSTANSNSYGISLDYSSSSSIINSTFNSNSYGIYLYSSSNNRIINSIANSNSIGIYLSSNSNNNSIINSTSYNNSNGIYLIFSSNNQIINSTLQENSYYDFYIYASSDSECNNYLENIIGSGNRPIKYYNYSVNLANEILSELILCNADYSNITNITIDASPSLNNNMLYVILTDNSNFTLINSSYNYYGIYLESSSNNSIINSTSNYNSDTGIYLDSSSNNTIINSTSNYNSDTGIYLESSSNNSIINSTSNSNSYGISLDSSSNNSIINSTSNYNSDTGIYLESSSNNTIINSTSNSNYDTGIYLYYSSNNQIINSTANSNSYGIFLDYSSNNTIINSTSNSNYDTGIYLYYSSNNQIINSTSNSNFWYGILLDYSSNNSIINLTANSNSYGILLDYSSNNTIINSTSNSNYDIGIYLSSSSNNTIINSTSNNNSYGIYLYSSSNNTIINSTFLNNDDDGVTLVFSDYNKLENIYLSGFQDSSEDGIFYISSSNYNNITNITIANASASGFYLDSSNNNTISYSEIMNCGSYGIYLYSSQNNLIYNNLFNNTNNFYFAGTIYSNYWNTTKQSGQRIYSPGNYIGGNYWTNSTGNGFSDTCTDSDKDGFCDSPYILDPGRTGNNTDYLPLSNQADIIPPQYSFNSTNSTIAGTAVSHNLFWQDNVNLSYAIFSFDNCTGSFQNITRMSLSGTSAWSNFTVVINSTVGCTIRWKVYANDSNNNWNASEIFSYTTTSATPCQVYINASSQLPYTITLNNTYYCLNSSSVNTTTNGILFASGVQNSTLDCLGFNIDGSKTSNTYGIYLTGSNTKNNTIKNCNITDFYYGIYLNNGPNNNSIINSTSNSNYYGIYLESSSNNQIINSTFNSNTYGIYLDSSSNNQIINSTFNSNYYGIYLYSSSNNQIINSTSNSNYYGIYLLSSSNNNQIINSTANFNYWNGIFLLSSSNNQIINSTANFNYWNGIYLDSSSNNTIINSTLQENSYFDFYIYASSDTECNNYLENVIGSGNRPIKYYNYSVNLANEILSELILCNADYSNITNITIDASPSKKNNMLYVHRTDNSNFTLINSSYNYYGIYLESSSNNSIINSTSNYNSDTGIYLDSSSNNTIINSTSNSNSLYGIYLYSSSNNQIINSTSNSNSLYGIYLGSSSNNQIINSTANFNYDTGIYLLSSSDNQIINSTSNSNYYGIYLLSSSNNQIINSTFLNNDDDGVTLISSDYNKLENIYLSGFQDSSEDGIFYIYDSNYNNITNITIANASASGFYLDSSNNNTISYSKIMNCGNYSIYLYSSQDNLIYNNLFNNTNNFYFEGDIYSNYWNTTKQLGQRIYSSGNYIGGNYWTNSTGNGFSDTCTDSNKDGFCDSPYTLSSTGSNIDYLPLSNKADVIPPQYSLNSTNSTLAGSAVSHNLFWQDNVNLSYAIFSFDNCTGSFQNISEMSLSGTSAWSNFTVVINSTVGCTIRWKVYANDTSNNWNESEIFSYTTTSAIPCQVYINSLPYNITQNNTYYCLNTSSTNLAGTAIQFGNSSSWVIQNSTLDCLGFNIDGDDTGTDYGIYLTGSNTKNNTIKNCNITDFYYGIYLYSGPNNNTIINSTSNSNSYGIRLSSSSNNTIINSTLQENSNFDFYIYASSDSECNNYLENIIGSGNRPIKYYNYSINLANEVLSELILCNADNSNITNITIDASPSLNNNMLYVHRTDNSNFTQINSSYNYYGIYLYSSSNNNQIINSTSNSNFFGIYLRSSSNNNQIINSIANSNSYGIYLLSSSNNNSIINSTSNSNSYYGIYLESSSNNSIINSTSNNNSIGIYLLSSSNNNQIINSTSNNNSIGIYLYSSSSNKITGGSIASNTNQDYYLSSAGSTNNFTSTNFTAPRKIYFSDTTSWFNYNNRTDLELWLKTNVSAAATITRKLISWTQTLVQWNDTNSSGTEITARYNITGLNPNKYYLVYNNSVLTYILQTDSYGNLPSFAIYLSGEKEIKVKQEEAPQWSNNKTSPSSPTVYQPAKSYQFNITCTDDTGIFNAWLTLNGTNYYMSNQSSEFYKTLTDLPAGNYFFNFTCNDTYGITNTTDTWLYTIEKAKPILTISNSSFSINTSGLVGYWRLEEGSGSTAKDSSGYGDDGILYNNPTWLEGMFGKALSFNGSNYVEIPNSSVFNITEEMSVEAWFYAEQNQPTGGSNQIVQRLDWSNYKGFFLREGYQSNHEVAFYVANGTHWVSVSYSVSPGKWYHVVGSVKSNDKIKLYVNGSLVAEYPFVGNIVQETNKNIRIGYEFSGAAFNGTIDEVKIWNRSLTQDEIEMLYQSEVTYKTQTNFSCSANTNQVTPSLYRNTTLVSNPDVQNLTAGYYYYLCNASETQNFTQSALLAPLKVNPGTISLTISPELTKGIFYTNLTGSLLNVQYNVEVNKWNNATWNYNASSQKTEYWIRNDGTFPIDICQKANSNMVCQDPWCGSYEIYIGNVSWSNSTLNDASNPSFSTLYPLTLDYSGNKSAYNLEPGSTIYLRFWFFVPSYVPSGKYNTSIVFKAVEAGNPC